MRSFVAVEMPGEMREAMVAMQVGLPGRHVPEENLHLTLAFLGEGGGGAAAGPAWRSVGAEARGAAAAGDGA